MLPSGNRPPYSKHQWEYGLFRGEGSLRGAPTAGALRLVKCPHSGHQEATPKHPAATWDMPESRASEDTGYSGQKALTQT